MSLHICDNCYKTFNTGQHLNQHKNRKNKCKPYAEESKSNVVKLTANKFYSPILLTPCDSTVTTPSGLTDEFVSNDDNTILTTTTDSSEKSNDINNLSVTNLLEFIQSHKKILEDKRKLEATLISLKRENRQLRKENADSKKKMLFVNNFISDYKKQEKEANKISSLTDDDYETNESSDL